MTECFHRLFQHHSKSFKEKAPSPSSQSCGTFLLAPVSVFVIVIVFFFVFVCVFVIVFGEGTARPPVAFAPIIREIPKPGPINSSIDWDQQILPTF